MAAEKPTKPKTPAKPREKRFKADGRKLTHSQRAEAAALYRAGTCTLETLAIKFKKSPDTFSRLFKRMGVVKGETAEAISTKVAEATEARIVTDTEETLDRIKAVKDEHFKMHSGMAKLVWHEIVRCKKAGIDIATLKDFMSTLKSASEVMGNSRKELFAILNVEKHEKTLDEDDLPELTVRELTSNEVGQLQVKPIDDDDLDLGELDPGAMMMPAAPGDE